MKRWFLLLSLVFGLQSALIADAFAHEKDADEVIDLIQSTYLKIHERLDLSDSDQKLVLRSYAEKVAALDTLSFNAVILHLSWLFETRPDAMAPVALLMNEIALLAPAKPRFDERENHLIEAIDFAFTVWISVAVTRGIHKTVGVARAAAHDLPRSLRWKTGILEGTDRFWRSLTLSSRSLKSREKWLLLGVTSAEALYSACDLFLKKRRLDPLERLEKSSRKTYLMTQAELKQAQKNWQDFSSKISLQRRYTPQETATWASDLKTSQTAVLEWEKKTLFLIKIAPLLFQDGFDWARFNQILVFQQELAALKTDLRRFFALLLDIRSQIELFSIPGPNEESMTPLY